MVSSFFSDIWEVLSSAPYHGLTSSLAHDASDWFYSKGARPTGSLWIWWRFYSRAIWPACWLVLVRICASIHASTSVSAYLTHRPALMNLGP